MNCFLLLVYHLVLPVVLLAGLPGYVRKMVKRGGYRRNFGQRFGWFSPELRRACGQQKWTWIRAVSVGEMLQALRLARELRRQDQNFRAVISTTTSTGYALGRQRCDDRWLHVIYSPLDFYPIVARVWRLFDPPEVILVDSDLWPSFLVCAHRHDAPVHLANARLSPRSQRRYERLRWLGIPLLWRHLHRVYAQHPGDVERWVRVGVSRNRVQVSGSPKYDEADASDAAEFDGASWLHAQGFDPEKRTFLLGGSLHPGEEELLLDAYLKLRERFPDLCLVLVPRHVERTPEIETMLRQRSVPYARRTRPRFTSAVSVLLVDTTGELRAWYRLADVVVIGKSFSGVGGQNPVEPLLAGAPVVCGPHMENFAALVGELTAAQAMRSLADPAGLVAAVGDLLSNPEEAAAMVQRARTVLAFHQGAVARIAGSILESRPPLGARAKAASR